MNKLGQIDLGNVPFVTACFLVSFSFFAPYYLKLAGYVFLLGVLKYAVLAGIVLFAAVKRNMPSKLFVLIAIFYALYMFITAIKGNIFLSPVLMYAQNLIYYYFFDYCLSRKSRRFLPILFILLFLLAAYDLYTIIMYPEGLYSLTTAASERYGLSFWAWFLGIKNNRIWWLFPLVLIALVMFFDKKSLRRFVLAVFAIMIAMTASILVASSTSLVALLILIAGAVAAPFLSKFPSVINARNLVIAALIVNLFVVFFSNITAFNDLMNFLFGKDSTLTGRTNIWATAIDYIAQHPLLGYGWESSQTRGIKYTSPVAVNAHNELLEVMYEGGILMLLVFVLIMKNVAEKIDLKRRSLVSCFAAIALFAICAEMVAEVVTDDALFWVSLLLVYHLSSYEIMALPIDEAKSALKRLGS